MENYDHQEWRPAGEGIKQFRDIPVTDEDVTRVQNTIREAFEGALSPSLIRDILEEDRAHVEKLAESRFAEFYMKTQEMKSELTEESRRIWRDRGQDPPV